MDQHAQRRFTARRGVLALLFGVLGGPIAWAVQLNLNYSATPYLCGSAWTPLYYVTSAAAFVVTLAALLTARRSWVDAGREHQSEGPGVTGRTRMLAFAGLGSSAFFLFVIVVQALPVAFLDPCLR